MRKISSRVIHVLIALLLSLVPFLLPAKAYADQLAARSVAIGSSAPSAVTTHNYTFTLASLSPVGSMEFEYCTNSPLSGESCDAPAGLSVSGAILQSQSGETGFVVSPDSSANRIVLSRVPVSTLAIPVSYNFANITNQNTPSSPVYVRIATFFSTDGSGARTDTGAVAYSTANPVYVNGYVPPYLTFCVGVVVALNCANFNGTLINFGELSVNQPRSMSSQFSVATNDPGGYSTTLSGTTMTAGNNTIPSLNSPQASQPGNSQFGMNLRSNSNPSIGAEPIGIGSGVIANGFNTPDRYYFNNQVIVSSPIPSDFNIFTISYLVNIGASQRPGIYATTLTYIASAAF